MKPATIFFLVMLGIVAVGFVIRFGPGAMAGYRDTILFETDPLKADQDAGYMTGLCLGFFAYIGLLVSVIFLIVEGLK